jgi:hypothetical protein
LTLAPQLLADGQGSTFDATVGPVGFVVKVVAIHVAPARRLAMRSVESVIAEAGVGWLSQCYPLRWRRSLLLRNQRFGLRR